MNKQACIEAAGRAAKAAEEAKGRFALYLNAFGGNDSLTLGAEAEMSAAINAASEWKRIAEWHPSSRNKALRDRSLPPYLFGFVA